MSYAYYLTKKNWSTCLTDLPEILSDKPTPTISLIQKLHDKWKSLGLNPNSSYDGISRLPATAERPAIFRIMARDFFSEKFKMIIIDIPAGETP